MKKISNKNLLQYNTFSSSKHPLQSDFRVHFTIMNVRCYGLPYQDLIQQIASEINSNCCVHIIQISNIIDQKHVDVSVGLYNDIQAVKYLKNKKKIQLFDLHIYSIIVSRGFKSFINKYGPQFQQKQAKLQIKLQAVNKENKQTKNLQMVKFQPTNKVQIKQQQQLEQRIEQEKSYDRLWLFGIPAQFTKQDIVKVLQSKNISILESKWQSEDIMQYLQVNLQIPVKQQFIDKLSLKIQGFPFITIAPVQQRHKIIYSLLKYQLQFTACDRVCQQQVIFLMDKIGGVNILLKNDFRDEQCYTVLFNNKNCVEKLKKIISDDKNFCYVHRQQFPIRVGRLNKLYTFQGVYLSISKQKV